MSYTRYNASDLSIELIGEKDVARALGNCGKKAPLVIRNAVNETAKEGFRRLAFGGIHDAVRLLFCEDVNPRTLKNMDLFAVSEIRRPKNGGMEIRFFDRIEALRLLSELETSGTGAQALLSAIESGAAALKDGDKP